MIQTVPLALLAISLHLFLSFTHAAAAPQSSGPLYQPGAAIPPTNETAPNPSPYPAATALTAPFPSTFVIPITNPKVNLYIHPGQRLAITPYSLTLPMIYGLNILVEQTITHHGDVPISAAGAAFGPASIGITVKSAMPGTPRGLTYGFTATILRGLWEMTALFGSYTFNADVYVGDVRPSNLRGRVSVYVKVRGENGTELELAPSEADAAVMAA